MSIDQDSANVGGEFVRKGGVLVFAGGFSEAITAAKVNEILEQDREGRIAPEAGDWCVPRLCLGSLGDIPAHDYFG
jgi:hypothetical protein